MIYVGIDDTDNPESGGTGRVARAVAAAVGHEYPVFGVTRHQLLVDPRVPYTSNNSCNVIHLRAALSDAPGVIALADRLQDLLLPLCLPGSDPGLCIAGPEVAHYPFGRAVQELVVNQGDAWRESEELGVLLRALGGTGDGVIGALAGVILAAGGDDGRFVEVGAARQLDGVVTVEALLQAGIAEVRCREAGPLTAGSVDTRGGRVRPLLLRHRPVLLVEPGIEDLWQVVEMGKSRARAGEPACKR